MKQKLIRIAIASALLTGAAITIPNVATSARAESQSDVLSRLEHLERQNAAMSAEITKLKHRLKNDQAHVSSKHVASEARPRDEKQNSLRSHPQAAKLVSRFSGAYLAAIGGYENDQRANSPLYTGFGPAIQSQGLDGGFVGLAAGYNATSGALLVGGEVRYLKSTASRSEPDFGVSANTLLPTFRFDICCIADPSTYPISSQPDFFLNFNQTITTSVRKENAFDASARFGIIANDDLLFYGRIGVGVQSYEGVQTTSTNSSTCVNPIEGRTFSAGKITEFTTGCGSVSSSSTVDRNNFTVLAPYMTFGGGLESNFGPYFARSEAEFLYLVPITSTKQFLVSAPHYSERFSGAIGYRF
jgi:hypothetical protein